MTDHRTSTADHQANTVDQLDSWQFQHTKLGGYQQVPSHVEAECCGRMHNACKAVIEQLKSTSLLSVHVMATTTPGSPVAVTQVQDKGAELGDDVIVQVKQQLTRATPNSEGTLNSI